MALLAFLLDLPMQPIILLPKKPMMVLLLKKPLMVRTLKKPAMVPPSKKPVKVWPPVNAPRNHVTVQLPKKPVTVRLSSNLQTAVCQNQSHFEEEPKAGQLLWTLQLINKTLLQSHLLFPRQRTCAPASLLMTSLWEKLP